MVRDMSLIREFLVRDHLRVGAFLVEFTLTVEILFVATTASGASRIDMVFDVYLPDSIKNAERGQCRGLY